MEREVGGGIGMGNTCKPMAVSFQCMTKFTTHKKKKKIAEKRREAKGKGEKERYTHLNAEFQRRARRDQKAFLSDQCEEIEENNRMGKT